MIGDRYEIGREVGRGGTGSVYRGRDTVLERPVALKSLGVSPGSDRVDADRAEREAHLAARLHHQNVVAVYDLVDDGDRRWLVMELVDGPDLAEVAAGPRVEPARAARLLAQVAAGLAAAHASGIVHRDVKPSNILVTADDVAKLSDFGVARGRDDVALTRTGIVTGSAAYLAPEVATGRTATTASDVWSFGATAYHLVTGTPPYDVGTGVVAAVESILDSPPPRLPDEHPLATLVATTLQHDPAARPSMEDVRNTLALVAGTWPVRMAPLEPARLQSGPRELAPPNLPPPSGRAAVATSAGHRVDPDARRRRRTSLVAAAVLVATGGLGAVQLFSGPDADPVAATADPTEVAAPDRAEVLTDFVTGYLRAAASDPAEGFALLGSDFQAASGGLEGYSAFWGRVSDLEIHDLVADEAQDAVACTWSYAADGGRREQSVVLFLDDSDGTMKIARAATA